MPVQSRYPNALKDQRQFFDELITEDWESYKSEAWDVSRRGEVARLFRTMRPARILDIGCGCGFHDAEMARYDCVQRIDAIDYSVQSIRKADEAYPHPKVFRRVADLETDDPGAVFDLVVSFQVLEHLVDPAGYFRYCLCSPARRSADTNRRSVVDRSTTANRRRRSHASRAQSACPARGALRGSTRGSVAGRPARTARRAAA